jgi:hypothetical protein
VFEFRFEPFVHPQPRLLRVLKAGDWTSQLDIGAAPMTVVRERYGGSEPGLGDPATVELGVRHPQTLFGLPNQVRDDMSIFTFVPPMEDPVAQLSVFPPPGRYPHSVRVQIAGDRPNLQIRYRLNQGAWQIYAEPFVVFASSTVQFYAQHTLSVARSTIHHARYDFDLPPEQEQRLTLTPFRLVDRGRLGLDANVLALVESPFGDEPPYRVSTLFQTIDGLIGNSTHEGIVALIQVAGEIYRLSSALNNDAPGVYPPPVDVLRSFIEEGILHPAYAEATSLPPHTLGQAFDGVYYIRQQLGFRPLVTQTARIRFDTFTAPCRVLDALDGLDPMLALFDEAGRPFSFPDTFRLLPGTVLRVSGYDDLIVAGCSGQSMEVTRVELVSVPLPGPGDSDGNLLDDDWENQFPDLLGDPFADSDGDGYPDIQEMWEGTDPLNPNDFPNVPPRGTRMAPDADRGPARRRNRTALELAGGLPGSNPVPDSLDHGHK